ncbi:hypothetical protein Indivirus_4_14 [Indivirus ILV1]|uniref:Uncharacterized protein n=1 Tax=Indivirus ILV1 TaxID=1977633 RepID=A0A1V0SDR1_9VIRU|nr:hypothetical protein Indivirus_4_14 [Indivirus ILV1]
MKDEITIGALFMRLHAVDKRLDNVDLQTVNSFIKQEKAIREEIENIRNNLDHQSRIGLRQFNMYWSKLQQFDKKIREVGGMIFQYVMLLECGWVDNRKIVSLNDIGQFVQKCHVTASVDIILNLWNNRTTTIK